MLAILSAYDIVNNTTITRNVCYLINRMGVVYKVAGVYKDGVIRISLLNNKNGDVYVKPKNYFDYLVVDKTNIRDISMVDGVTIIRTLDNSAHIIVWHKSPKLLHTLSNYGDIVSIINTGDVCRVRTTNNVHYIDTKECSLCLN